LLESAEHFSKALGTELRIFVVGTKDYLFEIQNCRMNVPNTPANISTSIQNIVTDLLSSEFAESNVDLNVDVMGVLNYTSGYKLRMTFVDSFCDDDIDEWRAIVHKNGACSLRTKVNTSSGHIDLNIEYKGGRGSSLNKQWLLRAVSLLVASWFYQQLHALNQVRYPFPTV